MTPDAELQLELDLDQTVHVVSCTIEEGLSQQTFANLEVATTEQLQLEGVLERVARLELAPTGFPARRWDLRVGHMDFVKIDEGSLRYRLQLFPAMWLMRFTADTRKFRNLSAQQIVEQVLSQHRVAHRFELRRETEVRKYCAQYRESNLNFVLRLLEFEGIFYRFDDDGTVVFSDSSPSADAIDGLSRFELVEAEGAMQWSEVGIHAFRKGRRVQSGTATVSDYNWKKPKLSLMASSAAAEDAELEVYDYPVGYRRPDQGKRIAKHRLEALRVGSSYREGRGNVTSFRPGRCFHFGNLAGAGFAGEYLLTQVKHIYANRKFSKHNELKEKAVNYRNDFVGLAKESVFRPALQTAHPHVAGCHSAMVRGPEGEEIHTDVHGRFRAQFHWDREATGSDEDSRWLRNSQEVASGLVLARVDWEQSIGYINGDPDRPFGLARHINGAMPAEYGQPSNKTRMSMKSPSYPGKGGFNEMRMEDIAGSQHMDWFAEKDMSGQVGVDRSEHIGVDETRSIDKSFSWSVGNDQSMTIGSNFTYGVGNDHLMQVGKNRTAKVGQDEELTITKVYSYKVTGNSIEKVKGDRILKAAEENGSIARATAEHATRAVTGAVQVTGDGSMSTVVQDTLTESVKGSKTVSVTDGGIDIRAGRDMTVTITGNVVRESKESMGAAAMHDVVDVAASARFEAGKKFAINGDQIVIEAKSNLHFVSNGLEVQLTPGKTKLAGKVVIDANVLKASGNAHNVSN